MIVLVVFVKLDNLLSGLFLKCCMGNMMWIMIVVLFVIVCFCFVFCIMFVVFFFSGKVGINGFLCDFWLILWISVLFYVWIMIFLLKIRRVIYYFRLGCDWFWRCCFIYCKLFWECGWMIIFDVLYCLVWLMWIMMVSWVWNFYWMNFVD